MSCSEVSKSKLARPSSARSGTRLRSEEERAVEQPLKSFHMHAWSVLSGVPGSSKTFFWVDRDQEQASNSAQNRSTAESSSLDSVKNLNQTEDDSVGSRVLQAEHNRALLEQVPVRVIFVL